MLTTGDLKGIGRGPIDFRLVTALREIQLSRSLLLLLHLATVDPMVEVAAEAIAGAYAVCPGAVRELLTDPWLAVWAARHVRDGGPVEVDYLNGAPAENCVRAVQAAC